MAPAPGSARRHSTERGNAAWLADRPDTRVLPPHPDFCAAAPICHDRILSSACAAPKPIFGSGDIYQVNLSHRLTAECRDRRRSRFSAG